LKELNQNKLFSTSFGFSHITKVSCEYIATKIPNFYFICMVSGNISDLKKYMISGQINNVYSGLEEGLKEIIFYTFENIHKICC